MIVLVYLIGLVYVVRHLSKSGIEESPVAVLGYNYLYSSLLMLWVYLGNGEPIAGIQDAAYRILLSFYHGFTPLTFYLKLDLIASLETMYGYRPLLVNLRLQLLAVSYISSIMTVRFVLLALFKDAMEKIRNWWLTVSSKHIYLVRGKKRDVDVLMADIYKNVKRAAVIRMYRAEDGTGGDNETVLSVLRPGKEYDIVLLPLPGDENVSLLHTLNEHAKDGKWKLRVTAFADTDLIRFGDLRYPEIDTCLVSADSLLIGRFLSERPPAMHLSETAPGKLVKGVYRPARPFRLALIGFQALAQEFLLQTYERTGFFTGDDDSRNPQVWGLEASVIDGDMSRLKEGFFRDVPFFANASFITWHDMWTESEGFYRLFETPFDQILISTAETGRNVQMAKRIYRMLKQMGRMHNMPQILVVLRDSVLYEMTQETLSSEYASEIELMQANETQFTYEEMILRKTDEAARSLHERYIRDRGSGKEWRKLSTFSRESNRAVIGDITNKKLLGQAIENLEGAARDEALWEMARYEHRRWCAFHYAHGWMRLPAQTLTSQETGTFVTKHTDEKRHSCLVSWDELDMLPQREPGILKWFDYANVLALFDRERAKAQAQGKDREV